MAKRVEVIDSIEERYDNEKGWGKYTVFLEGYTETEKIDVPKKVNAQFDLEEGGTINLVEGPYCWIVHEDSPCFQNGGGKVVSDNAEQRETTEPSRGTARRSAGRSARTSPTVGKSAPPVKGRRSSRTANETKLAPKKDVAVSAPNSSFSNWNDYQMAVRDPHMRMQAVMAIVQKHYRTCLEFDIPLNEGMDELMDLSGRIDNWIAEHLDL